MSTILAGLAVLYLALCGTMYVFQDRLLFLPDVPGRDVTATPAALDLRFEPLSVATSDGERLAGWWVPADKPGRTLIHFHGNAGNIGHRLELLQVFHGLGFNVVLFDYRGYGASSGAPAEAGLYRDAEAMWAHLTTQLGIAPQDIVLHGQSLGAAVAAWLAARVAPGALIVESAFTSVPEMAAELYVWLPARWLARLQFDTRAALRAVRVPVLVIHSTDDEIIPYAHGQRLFEAANEPKRLLTIAGDHNAGFWRSREAYSRGIRDFQNGLPRAAP